MGLLARTALTTALLVVGLAAPASAVVNGISDDNLPLLTARGRAVAKALSLKHARVVVAYGTPYHDRHLTVWMATARELHWTSTLAVRRDIGQPVPSPTAYRRWLRGLLRVWPQVTAVEATNEPDLTGIRPERAAAFYRAARRAAGDRVEVLAGGFSDRPTGLTRYVRDYARRVHAPLWAFHFYRSVVDNHLSYARRLIRLTHARRVWITETAAFTALGRQTFTHAQSDRQARRVLRMSEWPRVERTLWEGLEACHGCQPTVSAPAPATATGPAPSGPVLPYTQKPSPIVWDSYLLSTTGTSTSTRPVLASLLGG